MSDDTLFALKREAAGEPFEFTVDGYDGKIRIPHTGEVDQFELARLISDSATNLDFITNYFRLFMDEGDLKALQSANLSRPMLNDLWAAFEAHCGLKPGESKASSG